jgi:hypothetical protein
MTLKDFIREHRSELDAEIKGALGRVPRTASCYCPLSGTDHYHETQPLNDSDRRQWILSDEGLYRWARSEGVRI